MANEYRSLNRQALDSSILFFGEEECQPDEYFEGNNLRKNNVLYYILKGKGQFATSGAHATQLSAGDLFLVQKSAACTFRADHNQPWAYFWIGLAGDSIDPIIAHSNLVKHKYLRQIKKSNFYQTLQKLYQALHQAESLTNNLLIATLTYQLLYYLVLDFPLPPIVKRKSKSKQYQIALTYLQQNYSKSDCNIIELSRHLGVSRGFLYALFKKESKLSPQKYLMKLRMEAAKKILRQNKSNLKAVAHQVGYGDEFTFSKAFKRYSGISPKDYRRK